MEEEQGRVDDASQNKSRNVLSFDDPDFQPARFVNEKFPDGTSFASL